MDNKLITLLVGPPGSGKSTYASQIAKEFTSSYVLISQDDQGSKGHLEAFNKALEQEINHIVIDRMGFSKNQRERYLIPAMKKGYTTEIIVFHESYETCFQRCIDRIGNHKTITSEQSARAALHTFFSKYERVCDNEASVVYRGWPVISPDSSICWVDIDGTLADCDHRRHLVRNETGTKNWPAFFARMKDDTVNSWCRSLVNHISKEMLIYVCSGRPDDYRELTSAWLRDNNIWFDKLLMRNQKDSRSDVVIKEIIYEFEVKTRGNVVFAIDDRKGVIDMLRSHGVTVLDCAGQKGDF